MVMSVYPFYPYPYTQICWQTITVMIAEKVTTVVVTAAAHTVNHAVIVKLGIYVATISMWFRMSSVTFQMLTCITSSKHVILLILVCV